MPLLLVQAKLKAKCGIIWHIISATAKMTITLSRWSTHLRSSLPITQDPHLLLVQGHSKLLISIYSNWGLIEICKVATRGFLYKSQQAGSHLATCRLVRADLFLFCSFLTAH